MTPIAPPVQALLDLFATTLSDVRFADIDAQALARVAAEVHAAADVVDAAQAALDGARAALQERQDALHQLAQRALAYARVYGESDAELTAKLEAIALPRPQRRARPDGDPLVLAAPQPAPRPRGRPRKSAVDEPTTPLAEEALLAGE